MKVPKMLKVRPFADSCVINELIPWSVEVSMPVADGERFLCVDFIKNENYRQKSYWKSSPDTFRVVCSKKQSDYRFAVKPDGFKYRTLQEAIYAVSSPMSGYVNISERAEEMLRHWTGEESTNHQINTLCDWCKKARAEKIKKQRAARGEIADEEYRLCPVDIPEGLEEWIVQEVLPRDEVLIYKKGNVRGFCHVCGYKVTAHNGRFRQYEPVRCPICGTRVMAILENGKSYFADYVANVAAVQKSTDGDAIFIRMWHLCRDEYADYTNMAAHLEEFQRFAIRGNKVARWVKEYKGSYFCGSHTRKKYPQWVKMKDVAVYDSPYRLFTGNIRDVTDGTKLQYADVDGYIADDSRGFKNPIRFLLDFARYPVLEFLQKGGYNKLISQWIVGFDSAERKAINKNGKTLQKCFKFPPNKLKTLPPEEWDGAKLLDMQWACRSGEKLNEEDTRIFLRKGIKTDRIESCLKYVNLKKLLKYLSSQEKSGTCSADITYADYIGECEKLNLDLTRKDVLFPKNLNAAHERTSAQLEYYLNLEKTQTFKAVAEKLEKNKYESGELLIRPARSPDELTKEGKTLHHCVGGYADRMASGETAIYLIRLKDYPDYPYYTLELKNKRVIQCHTLRNRTCQEVGEPFIQDFVNEWLEKVINKKIKKTS